SATGSIQLTGIVDGDSVSTTGATYAFANKSAGTNKTVTITGASLTGTDAGNYTVTLPTSALADILQKVLTATATANDKTYDGTTSATGSIQLTGIVDGDSVSTTGATYAFANKNAGTNKTVTISGASLTGTDAGNYTVTLPTSALADILQKALTATATANDKTYDGTTSATGSIQLTGVVDGDSVSTTGATYAFADKNAGTDKTVTISGASLTGTDAGNYTVTLPTSALADILQRALTVAADDASKKRGAPDPLLTYSITAGELVQGETLNGALAREPGEAVGEYGILQGSLTGGVNYSITFAPGTFTIERAVPTLSELLAAAGPVLTAGPDIRMAAALPRLRDQGSRSDEELDCLANADACPVAP
ncbi:MAG TPA: YDG domain-containing protein, partial [Caulobacteraceae bacterium]|nr:YDG domain-containing protein [Caulobacteraceae bacterium]